MIARRLAGIAAALFALLPGCTTPRGRPGETVLTIWSAPSGLEERGFLRLCARFEREHPGIRIHNVGAVTEDKLVRAIVASVPPDLAYLYGTDMVGPLAANGAAVALDRLYASAGFRDDQFLSGAIEQGRYNGHLYAMPVTRDSRGLYLNRTVFRRSGLDPDRSPETLEELLAMAVRLTVRRPDGTLERLGVVPPEDNALFIFLMGGRLYDTQHRRLTLDSPENVAAVTWIVKLVDAMGGQETISRFKSGFGRTDSSQNPLALGHVAMRIDGEWAAMHMEKYAPNADYGIGRLPHPASRPDLANMAWQDGDIMVIPQGAKHVEAAWEFMRWMQQPAQQEEYAGAMNNLPSIRALLESPALTRGSRKRETLGFILKEIAGRSRNPRIFPVLPVTRLCRDALDNAVEMACLHRKTPAQALGDAQARVQRELSRYAR